MNETEYHVTGGAYLRRAKDLLAAHTREALFYAAFELRCGIEARMREYLEEAEHIAAKKREGWRIAALGGAIQEAFGLGDKVARATVFSAEGHVIAVLHYRPVSSRLKNAAERLGDYLHVMRTYRAPNDEWWANTRTFLEQAARKLEWSVSGELLGPAMIHSDGRTYMNAVVEDSTVFKAMKGTEVTLDFQYLEPDEPE